MPVLVVVADVGVCMLPLLGLEFVDGDGRGAEGMIGLESVFEFHLAEGVNQTWRTFERLYGET